MFKNRIVKAPSVGTARYTVVIPKVVPEIYTANGDTDDRHVEVPSFFDDELSGLEKNETPRDLLALEDEARSIIESAEADAHAILIDARDRAAGLLETANTGAAEIEKKARDEGYSAGLDEGRALGEGEFTEALGVLRSMVESAREARKRFVESSESELVRLAMAIAERILHQQVAIDSSVVIEMAKAALSRLTDRETITIRVNPHDLETMRDHREEVLALGEVKQMRVIEDQRVDRGGVIIETEAGAVDAKMSTQIREARRVLNIDEDVMVAAPPAEAE